MERSDNKKQHKKIRKGDTVIAIAGNYRGQSGVVLSRTSDRIVVQGINMRKKHVKKSEQNKEGGIVEFEGSMHISNVKLCHNDLPVKVKVRTNGEGERELFYRHDGQDVLYRPLKKS